MVGEKSIVDTKGISQMLDGFDPAKPPSQELINIITSSLIEAEEQREMEKLKRADGNISSEKVDAIRKSIRQKYYTITVTPAGEGSTTTTTYDPNAAFHALEPEAVRIIQMEKARYAEAKDPISGMKMGEYIAKARSIFQKLDKGAAITNEELAFTKEFTRRVQEDPRSLLLDMSKSGKPAVPAEQQFSFLPDKKDVPSPIFNQWLDFGGGESLERFEGIKTAIKEHERLVSDTMRYRRMQKLPQRDMPFSLPSTDTQLFNLITSASWVPEIRDGKEVMVAVMDYPRGLVGTKPIADMAKAKAIPSLVFNFERSGPTLRQVLPWEEDKPLQMELQVHRAEYDKVISPVINRNLIALKATKDDFDPDSKSYGIRVDETAVKTVMPLLERLEVKASREDGSLHIVIADNEYQKAQKIFEHYPALTSLQHGYKGDHEFTTRGTPLPPEQKAKLLEELAAAHITYSLTQDVFVTIPKEDYDKKVAPIIEQIEKASKGNKGTGKQSAKEAPVEALFALLANSPVILPEDLNAALPRPQPKPKGQPSIS